MSQFPASHLQAFFQKAFIDRVVIPPEREGDNPTILEACIWFDPVSKSLLKIQSNPESGHRDTRTALEYSQMSPVTRIETAKNSYRRVVTLTHDEAAEVYQRELHRRALWLKLADALAGIKDHDIEALREELNITPYDVEQARIAIQKTLKLGPQCSEAALTEAKDNLQQHVEKHGDGAQLNKRQAQLDSIRKTRITLKSKIELLNERKRELARIARKWPMLFPSTRQAEVLDAAK